MFSFHIPHVKNVCWKKLLVTDNGPKMPRLTRFMYKLVILEYFQGVWSLLVLFRDMIFLAFELFILFSLLRFIASLRLSLNLTFLLIVSHTWTGWRDKGQIAKLSMCYKRIPRKNTWWVWKELSEGYASFVLWPNFRSKIIRYLKIFLKDLIFCALLSL